ncbi:MAG: PP2C family protein-serine/threonine phosphatase [Phycisphaerae bacterium]
MRFSFRVKLFLILVLYAAALVAGLLVYTYRTTSSLPKLVTQNLLLTMAANAAPAVDADAVRRLDEDPQARQQILKELREIANTPVSVETANRTPAAPEDPPFVRRHACVLLPANGTYRVAAATFEQTVGSELAQPLPAALQRAAVGPTVDADETQSALGRTLNAYAPIRDENGRLVGILVVSAEGGKIAGARRQIIYFGGGLFVVSMLVAILLAWYISNRLNRPIEALDSGMADIRKGRFDTRIGPMETKDEFEPLAEGFNRMAEGLQEHAHMKEAMGMAVQIQRHLLPHDPPQICGLDISGSSDYCDATGGDYYDFIPYDEHGDRRLGIAVGDVTGHGIGAALLMASARAVLRSHVSQEFESLGKMFEDINVHLVRDTGDERFMTLFYGVMDPHDRSLRWTSAGHDPAIWYKSTAGQFAELPNTGIPLGIVEEAQYHTNGPIRLESGDILVIGTDGIWESRNAEREDFGKERLKEVVQTNAERSSGEIRRAILDATDTFRGSNRPQDDVTLVVIKAL